MNYNRKRLRNSLPARALPTAGQRRPYVINEAGNGEYEIQMYGEVVEEHPIDFWTGQPVEGLFIVLTDFLKDIDNIKNASSVKVRINSPGGDLEAGVAIYNRLKAMKNVTTIVDGIAASAASLIFQAGNTRQIYQNSQVMVHSASMFLFDYYNLEDLQEAEKQLAAANDQVIGTYVERTGRERVKVKHMVETTTWMTGQEIIDEGFADELIQAKVPMAMSADKRFVISNGIRIDSRVFGKILPSIKETADAGTDPAKSKKEVKRMTLDELKKEEPDLVKSIEDAAKATVDTEAIAAQARDAERQRIRDIESIEATIADKDLVNAAKFGDKPMDAKELAFTAMQKQAQIGNQILTDMRADADDSGAKNVEPEPVDGIVAGKDDKAQKEAKDKADIEAAAKALGFGKETK